MTPQQIQNAKYVNQALIDVKLTNIYLRAGILAVLMKESGLIPVREYSYSTTPAKQIRKIFGTWFSNMTDAQIDILKKDDVAFFNHVYSNNKRGLGNLGGMDGYNFRGAMYNQLTGRANFTNIGKRIGMDLVANPDLLNSPEVAAKVAAAFFYDSIVAAQGSGKFKQRHGITRTAELKDLRSGAYLAHDINGGFNILPELDPTEGWQKTLFYAPQFYSLLQTW